jgi:hypothetical protein
MHSPASDGAIGAARNVTRGRAIIGAGRARGARGQTASHAHTVALSGPRDRRIHRDDAVVDLRRIEAPG